MADAEHVASPGPLIRLAVRTFDPRATEVADNEPLSPRTRSIVQFTRALTADDRARIQERFGLQLTSYLPDLAYLELVPPGDLARLRDDELVRAVVPYRPEYKVSPLLGRVTFRTEGRSRPGGTWVRIDLFPDADPGPVVAYLEGAGASDVTVNDDRPLGGDLHVLAVVPSIEGVADRPEVRWIEEVPEHIEDNVAAASTIQSGSATNPAIWNQNIHGEGQVMGIIDSGPLDINHCFFQDPVNNTPSLTHRKVLQIRNAAGSAAGGHATFTAGNAAGDDFNNPGTAARRGGAWAARLVVGNNADIPSPNSMLTELSSAAALGAVIHTNSWHDNTAGAGNPATYNQTAADVDTFSWNNEDHLVFGSAGNTGEEQGPPGTAKNAVCVGAAQAAPNQLNFGDGNAGPTADGRRKPDLMAVGCSIQSATVGTACSTGPRSACATSYATPHAAAAVALIRQYFTEGYYPTGTPQPHHVFEPSGALLKSMLISSTVDMTGIAGYPSAQEGWGLVQLSRSLFFPGSANNLRVWDTRNADGLFTGDVVEHPVVVATNTQPLKVVLVWTDPPGAAGSATPVVNNLDLEVVSPDGTQTFRGNVFGAAGFSSTGGTADTVNNVEVVLVNTPTPGRWTVRVRATAVNVGNPGQGYALGVTGDLPEPPVSTGVQDTVVVRARFADVALDPSLANLQNLMADADTYVREVSYGQTTVVPLFRGIVSLDHPKDYYYHPDRNLLIELTQEIVAKLVATEPNLFATIERMVIVTNDVNFSGDWATTGPWPYDLPGGFTAPISVSVQSYANAAARFSHGLLHQFGLVDLYAHPGVVFPRPYVDEWDNMGGTYNNVHPLVWSKERAGWLTAHGDTITYIPRPAAGGTYTGPNPIPIFPNTSTAANRKAIAIGLTQGASTLAVENAFYFVEARRNTAGTFDATLPQSGVLVYHVNEMVPQGEGPVILRDKNLLTQSLSDAAFTVGDVITLPGTGITLTVQAGTSGAAFNIQVAYSPPVTDYNVFITRGDTVGGQFFSYLSPDIWVDSPKNGFNLGGGPPPHEQREKPVAGVANRLYARVHNAGPGTAFDFDVRFRISEPYHTVGGEADFDKFVGIVHVGNLPVGQSDIFAEWTPVSATQPHACLRVDLINLVGTDTNDEDNWAQENLEIVASVSGSPFYPVTQSYSLKNPYENPALFYFRAEGVEPGWTAELTPTKIRLLPGETVTGQVTITPPENGEPCTSHWVSVTSWTPRGDTLINVGGAVVQVDLRRPTVIDFDVGTSKCDGRDLERLFEEMKKRGEPINPTRVRERCGRITAKGCTNPPVAGQEIIVKYVDPLGQVTYHTVTTDQNGCFEDIFASATVGTWQVSAEYPGGKCEGPTETRPVTVCWCR
jgi:hypothetical protein